VVVASTTIVEHGNGAEKHHTNSVYLKELAIHSSEFAVSSEQMVLIKFILKG
jgi:hypothetical protein